MIKPMKDKLLVRILKEEDRTKSGLFLPDERVKNPVQLAEVLSVGPWQEDVKAGEKVLLAPYSGTEIKVDGETLHLIEAVDVLAVAEEA